MSTASDMKQGQLGYISAHVRLISTPADSALESRDADGRSEVAS